jgi:VanZ family protein
VVLLLLYVVFVVYGSFFPFDFEYDPHALARAFKGSPGRLSIPDVVSNIPLGIPFGVLMVWSGLAGASLASRLARVALLDAALASAVEVGQLFAPSRTSSRADVIAQVIGSLAGLLVMHGLLAGSRRPLGPRLAAAFHRRPVRFVLLAFAAVLAADALYPFAVTLDVSTVWHHLKSGQWRRMGSFARAFWPDLLVEKLLAYAGPPSAARPRCVATPRPGSPGARWRSSPTRS